MKMCTVDRAGFACSEACCQAFDSEGSCPGGFTLYKLNNLNSLDPRTYTTPRALLDSIPLAGFNEVEKMIFQQYVDQKNISELQTNCVRKASFRTHS